MTRQELIEQVNGQSKRMNRGGIIWLASLFIVVTLLAAFADEPLAARPAFRAEKARGQRS